MLNVSSVSSTSAQPDARLRDAAQHFEASFARELLRPFEESASPADDSSDDDGPSGAEGTIRSMATEAMADAISAHGGLGLAHAALQQLSGRHAGNQHSTPALHGG